jgi:hypothetical protein
LQAVVVAAAVVATGAIVTAAMVAVVTAAMAAVATVAMAAVVTAAMAVVVAAAAAMEGDGEVIRPTTEHCRLQLVSPIILNKQISLYNDDFVDSLDNTNEMLDSTRIAWY